MKIKPIVAMLAAGLLCASHSYAENYHFDSVAIGGGGFVSGIVPSKSERGLVYVRTDVGGAYRWDVQQARWVSMMDWVSDTETGYLGVESLAVDPRNSANVYMLAGTSYLNGGKTAILRSSDYGRTFAITDVSAQFKAHGNGTGRQAGEKLQVDPASGNILYVGTRRNGLFKSTDTGATWTRLPGLDVTATDNDNGVGFVLLDPDSVDGGAAQRLFAGISRFNSAGPNLYVSNDAGLTFEEIEGGPAGMIPQRAALGANGMLYITYANGAGTYGTSSEPLNQGQIWEYDTNGGNWTNVTPAGVTSPFAGISIDPANPKRLVASTMNTWRLQYGNAYGDRIYSSSDRGRTWTDLIARGFSLDNKGVSWVDGHAIHWTGSIEFDPFDTKSVLVISGNGLFRNADISQNNWSFEVAGLEETVPLNAVSMAGLPLVSAIGDYDGFMHSDPTAYAPIHNPQMGTTTGLAVAALDTRIMARAGNSLYYSTTSGSSWTKSAAMNGSKGQLALSADGAVLLHSPENSATTYRSVDFGTNWTAVSGLSASGARPVADPVNPAKFYAYDNGKFQVSTDGGISFSTRATMTGGGSNILRTVPGVEGDIWACLYSGGLMHSTDSGATFSKIATVSNCGAVGFGKAAPGGTYPAMYMWGTVGNAHGLLRSLDQGASWVRVNDDAHEYGGPGNGQFVLGDMNTYGTVYMSTSGRGLVYGMSSDAGEVTAVPVDPASIPVTPTNKCEYVITASWGSGYNAAVRITNNGSTPINGWTVNWTYSDNSVVQGFWNAAVSGSSPNYSATDNQSWNHTIYPGGTAEFGMTVAGSPSAIPKVTGAACN